MLPLISLDLGPNHTGFVVFWGEDRVADFGTILPQKTLPMSKRIQYTVGILRVLCQVYGVREAAIEDYAHKLRSASVTSIREQGGAIKQMLIEDKIKLFIYNISTIKKFATGMGDADKEAMANVFEELATPEIMDKTFRRITRRKPGTFTEDEIDAWFIGRLHFDNVRKLLLDEDPWPCESVVA